MSINRIDRVGDKDKQPPPVDKKCRRCKTTKLLHEFDLRGRKRDSSCKECRDKEVDEMPIHFCTCNLLSNLKTEIETDPEQSDVDDLVCDCHHDECLAELTQRCAEKILEGIHDKTAPFVVEDINDVDKLVNTLLVLAEHLNRVRYSRDRNIGSIKVKDFGKS